MVWLLWSVIPSGSSLPAHLPSHGTTACAGPSTTGQGAAPCTLLPSYHCQLGLYCYSTGWYFTEWEQIWFWYHVGKLHKKKNPFKNKRRKQIIFLIKILMIFGGLFIFIFFLFQTFSWHRMAIGQTMSVRRRLATFVKEKLHHK